MSMGIAPRHGERGKTGKRYIFLEPERIRLYQGYIINHGRHYGLYMGDILTHYLVEDTSGEVLFALLVGVEDMELAKRRVMSLYPNSSFEDDTF